MSNTILNLPNGVIVTGFCGGTDTGFYHPTPAYQIEGRVLNDHPEMKIRDSYLVLSREDAVEVALAILKDAVDCESTRDEKKARAIYLKILDAAKMSAGVIFDR